jgi:hypothetical protein
MMDWSEWHSFSEGILYIGEGSVVGRVGNLQYIFSEGAKYTHHFIETFDKYELSRICDRDFLQIRWIECEDCKSEERRLIEDYKRRFGDIPPGNLKPGG